MPRCLSLLQFWEVVGGGLFGLCERWGEARIFYGRYRRVRYLGKILVEKFIWQFKVGQVKS